MINKPKQNLYFSVLNRIKGIKCTNMENWFERKIITMYQYWYKEMTLQWVSLDWLCILNISTQHDQMQLKKITQPYHLPASRQKLQCPKSWAPRFLKKADKPLLFVSKNKKKVFAVYIITVCKKLYICHKSPLILLFKNYYKNVAVT